MNRPLLAFSLLLFSSLASAQSLSGLAPEKIVIEAPATVLRGIPFDVTVKAVDGNGNPVIGYSSAPNVRGVSTGPTRLAFENGVLEIDDAVVSESGTIRVEDGALTAQADLRAIPGVLSILPPILAITLAIAFRQVILSLFAGVWLAGFFLNDYGVMAGFFAVLTHFVIDAVTTKSQAQILIFTLLFGGMVGVISKNGGARGIAELITRYAKSPRGGQLAALGMAFVVFFDDYANILIRGNLMRPITDRLRISREKLSFIVDTGAAAVASTVLISTWIGYEVGLIEQGLRLIDSDEDAYTMFVRSIPFRFYPIFAMVFAFLVAWTGRDFGPMLLAERRARHEGKVIRDGARPVTESLEDDKDATRPASWVNGLAPILTTLFVGVFGIYYTGMEALAPGDPVTVGNIVSGADSYVALLWASLAGCAVAIVLAAARRVLPLGEAFDATVSGFKAMVMALVILVLAWSIGAATAELHAASYLVQILEGALNPVWLPVLTFVIAAAMAFATGTSWATMAILMPLVIPLTNALGINVGYTPEHIDTLLLGVISSVLAGAVFGDHCSPISDTTILSSMASASDHIDHVRTQLPYALLVAVVGMLFGDIPTAFGVSPWISIVLGTAVLAAVLYLYAKPVGADGGTA